MQSSSNNYSANLKLAEITLLDKNEKKKGDKISKRIQKLIRQILVELGENPDREGLIDTPRRIAEMYEEIFAGYRMNAELDTNFSEQTDGPIIAKNIEFYSLCEHHMLSFYGKVHIAYIPSDGKVFGISKLARLVEKYARRMQTRSHCRTKGYSRRYSGPYLCIRIQTINGFSLIKSGRKLIVIILYA